MRWWMVCGVLGCGSPPTDSAGGDTGPDPVVDNDGDGASEADDCDDADASVYPGASELCDGKDNDCDSEIDEGVTQTWHRDADGDGYGDPRAAEALCEVPGKGYVENDQDCDDADDAVNPNGDEVCDGIDNDCDDQIDGDTVPTTWPTVQAAIDAASPGAEICLEAGSYDVPFDVSGKDVVIVGAGGEAGTRFDLSKVEPPFVAVHEGTVTLRDLGVEGLAYVLPDRGYLRGTFLRATSSDVTLERVAFERNAVRTTWGCSSRRGGMLYVLDGTLSATDVEVSELDVEVGPYNRYECGADLGGGWLYAGNADVTLTDVLAKDVTGNVFGGERGPAAEGLLLVSEGGTLTIDGLDIAEPSGDLALQGVVSVRGAQVDLRDILIADGAFTTNPYGLLYVAASAGTIDGVTLTDNESLSPSIGAHSGLLVVHGADLTVDHVTMTGNEVESPQVRGGLVWVEAERTRLRWLDLRANTISGQHVGGGLVRTGDDSDDVRFENLIAAGNQVEGTTAVSGGVFGLYGTQIVVSQADVVAHEVSTPRLVGGLLYQWRSDAVLTNLSWSGADVTADVVEASLGYADSSTSSWSYVNAHPTAASPAFVGLTPPTTKQGYLSVEPAYVDLVSIDPTLWDLTLGKASPLVDAGDPAVLDADGSTSDVGAYGGPHGAGW